mgnify:FL=1
MVDRFTASRDLFTKIFAVSTDFTLVGQTSSGQRAIKLVKRLQPDLVILDPHCLDDGGYETVSDILQERKVAILVVTTSAQAETAYRCLELGALEVVSKPDDKCKDDPSYIRDFLNHARMLVATSTVRLPNDKKKVNRNSGIFSTHMPKRGLPADFIVTIAASTGGPQALSQLLGALPRSLPAAVLIVQHLGVGFEEGLISWLDSTSSLDVKLAKNGLPLLVGTVYVCPPDYHLAVTKRRSVELVDEEPVAGQKPSATYLFESGAAVFGSRCTGVILTGMGGDGAEALDDIRLAGGLTIAQDEATSAVYGMPRVAAELGSAREILSLAEIAPRLVSWLGSGESK